MSTIQLHGFNNLTKSVNCSLYELAYIPSDDANAISKYQGYIAQRYSAKNLSQVLEQVTHTIGAQVLNSSMQDYQPQGASVTVMIADAEVPLAVVNHLNKSHICVHTYPETHFNHEIAIFRMDIDISTCGVISPLKAINLLIKRFNSDILTVDYKVRGFTRDIIGDKHFFDDNLTSIQEYIKPEHKLCYEGFDDNQNRLHQFHTQLAKKQIGIESIVKFITEVSVTAKLKELAKQAYKKEINHIINAYKA